VIYFINFYAGWNLDICCAELMTFGGNLICILVFVSQLFSLLGCQFMFTDTLLDLFPVSGCCKLAMVFDGLV